MNLLNSPPANGARVTGKFNQPTGLGWALWSVAGAVPWLLPTRAEPWTTFYSEFLMAAVLIPIAFWAFFASRGAWRTDKLVIGFALLAGIPLLQALGGMFAFPGEAHLIALYCSGVALTVWVAHRAESVAPLRLVEALLASLAVAAIVSTGLALYQWLKLDALGVMVAPAVDGRPGANLGQPNNLSMLLVWGLIAVWWGYAQERLGAAAAFLAVAFLLVGVALTQSRTGMVAVLLLGFAAALGKRYLRHPVKLLAVGALLVWFMTLVLGLEPASQLLMQAAPRTLGEQVAVGTRPMAWMMALDAIAQRPWLGYGWNQSVQAHIALAAQYPHLHQTFQFAHNVVLDLALWNGFPLGMLLVGGLAWWLWLQIRGVLTQEQWLLLLALGVFLLHAMLELPHALAFFLLPVALMVGTLSARRPLGSVFFVPRSAVGLVVLAHTVLLVVMFDEYRSVETDLMTFRMREAKIGGVAETRSPDVFVLSGLQSGLVDLRIEPRRGMAEDQLLRLRQAVIRYPSAGGLLRYSRACALNGRLEEARWALGVLCRLNSNEVCKVSAMSWNAIAADGNPEMMLVKLPIEMTNGR